jgi:hypothetical protein
VKGRCRQGKPSRRRGCRLQKSQQKKLGRYKRFAANPAISEFLHHSPVGQFEDFLHLVSDMAHDMIGHDDEGAVQSAVLAATVHSIMETAFF